MGWMRVGTRGLGRKRNHLVKAGPCVLLWLPSLPLPPTYSRLQVKGKDEYDLDFKYDGEVVSGTGLGDLYQELARDFPIVTVEDPFDEDDWENWSKFTKKNSKQFQVVGDDLTVTNIEKIGRAIDEESCTCLLLKVNEKERER